MYDFNLSTKIENFHLYWHIICFCGGFNQFSTRDQGCRHSRMYNTHNDAESSRRSERVDSVKMKNVQFSRLLLQISIDNKFVTRHSCNEVCIARVVKFMGENKMYHQFYGTNSIITQCYCCRFMSHWLCWMCECAFMYKCNSNKTTHISLCIDFTSINA